MIQVLVTGANGQLGMAIRAVASEYPGINFIFKSRNELDITDSKMLENLWQNNAYDYCINCAAYTDVEKAEREPERAFLVNAEGVKKIAEKCQEYNSILIHISTDYVFDGEKETGYYPSDKTNPINQYGKSKLLAEEYIQNILAKYFIIRTSWLYSKYGVNFCTKILEKANDQKVIHVTNYQIGCPTHAISLAKYILDLIGSGNTGFGIHHFTDGVPMTWYDLACKIINQENLDTKVRVVKDENYRSFAPRPKYCILKQN